MITNLLLFSWSSKWMGHLWPGPLYKAWEMKIQLKCIFDNAGATNEEGRTPGLNLSIPWALNMKCGLKDISHSCLLMWYVSLVKKNARYTPLHFCFPCQFAKELFWITLIYCYLLFLVEVTPWYIRDISLHKMNFKDKQSCNRVTGDESPHQLTHC